MTADKNSQRAFLNRVRSLYNIDKSVIDRALKETGAEAWSFERWEAFMTNPPRFLIACDDPTADAIWRCVEARQKPASLSSEVLKHQRLIHAVNVAASALDVADRLIERAYGVDKPQEWDGEYRNFAAARTEASR